MKAKSKQRVYKPKTCPQCLKVFTPDRYLQKVCGPLCAVNYQRAARIRLAERDRKDKLKIRKLEVKPLSYFRGKAQAAFNAYIRERDAGEPCISCGRHHQGQYHAGHYRTVGSNPELSFDEDNCHKQCSACNNHKSGNLSQYRPNLIEKIGPARFDRLTGPHELKHFNREDYQEIAVTYRRKTREMKKEKAA